MAPARFDATDPLDRIDQFIQFVDWWFEHDQRPRNFTDLDVDGAIDALDFEVPEVLVRVYNAARHWPITRPFSFNQNDLLSPDRFLSYDADRALLNEHGLLVFAYENQGVTCWSCPLGEVDPPVYDREYEFDVGTETHDFPAGRCSQSLVDFLIDFTLLELSVDAPITVTLTGFIKFLEVNPDASRSIGRDGFGQGHDVRLFEDMVIAYRTRYGTFVGLRPGTDQNVLARFAGPVQRMTLSWKFGQEREERSAIITFAGDGTAAFECRHGRTERFSSEVAIDGLFIELYELLMAGKLQGDNASGPILHVSQDGTDLLAVEDVLESGVHIDWAVAGPIVDAMIASIETLPEAIVEDRPFLTGDGEGEELASLFRSHPALGAEFVRSDAADLLVGSTWAMNWMRVHFDEDGIVRTKHSPRSFEGVWRVVGDQLMFEVADHTYWLSLGTPRMPGRQEQIVWPFVSKNVVLTLVAAPNAPIRPASVAEAALIGTTWNLGADSSVAFLPAGVAHFHYPSQDTPSLGAWSFDGDQLRFEVNNFTAYEMRVAGETMTGVAFRVGEPSTRRNTSLTRLPLVSGC